jgi:hypothetical protein
MMPNVYSHTRDPWNAVAYLAGGVGGGMWWSIRSRGCD